MSTLYRFILQKIRGKKLVSTEVGVRLMEGARIIRGPLNTGSTVYVYYSMITALFCEENHTEFHSSLVKLNVVFNLTIKDKFGPIITEQAFNIHERNILF